MAENSITQDRLKEVLHYDPETGVFTWKTSLNNRSSQNKVAGFMKSNKYLYIGINNIEYGAHRLAFLYMEGSFPENQVDHINHIRCDNRWENLRRSTIQENRKNHTIRADSKTKILGVNWYKAYKKWQVRITCSNKTKNIGYFSDFFEACCARKSAEIKYRFHPNHGSQKTTA